MHPILLDLGGLQLSSYWTMAFLGFLVAALGAGRRARSLGLKWSQLLALAILSVLAGWGGARIGGGSGGLAFFGGAALGLPAVAGLLLWYRKPAAFLLDRTIPFLLLAMAFVRIGCFLQGCCYGVDTTFRWGVALPGENFLRHPVQMYESAFLLALFAVTVSWRSARPGSVLLTCALFYGAWRFGIGFLRADEMRNAPFGWTHSQWIGLSVAVLAAPLLIWRLRRRNGR